MADITIVNGVYKPTYNWGAPSCSNSSIVKPMWFWVEYSIAGSWETYPLVNVHSLRTWKWPSRNSWLPIFFRMVDLSMVFWLTFTISGNGKNRLLHPAWSAAIPIGGRVWKVHQEDSSEIFFNDKKTKKPWFTLWLWLTVRELERSTDRCYE